MLIPFGGALKRPEPASDATWPVRTTTRAAPVRTILGQILVAMYTGGEMYVTMTNDERIALIQHYAEGYAAVVEALDGMTGAEWESREGPNEWCSREIVHHLGDSEMNATSRIRMLVAEREPVVTGYDQDRWVEVLYSRERPIEPSLAAFKAARDATLPLLRLLTEEQWTREGRHSDAGVMTAETWLSWYGPHAHDHADQIRRARAAAG